MAQKRTKNDVIRRMSTALILFALLFSAAPESGMAKLTEPAYFYRVVTAEVQGLVFFSDGQTPAVDVPVRIWDLEKREFIYETTTDQYGGFYLPKLDPGRYYITFDSIRLELEVLPKTTQLASLAQQPHDIIVIIPRGTASMPLTQLNTFLIASTITEGAMVYQGEERRTVVSP